MRVVLAPWWLIRIRRTGAERTSDGLAPQAQILGAASPPAAEHGNPADVWDPAASARWGGCGASGAADRCRPGRIARISALPVDPNAAMAPKPRTRLRWDLAKPYGPPLPVHMLPSKHGRQPPGYDTGAGRSRLRMIPTGVGIPSRFPSRPIRFPPTIITTEQTTPRVPTDRQDPFRSRPGRRPKPSLLR